MPIQLSGSGSITGVSTLTSLASLDVTGSVSVGGTLIYDDVTNIDSLGIVTARSDVHVGSALSVTGISTFNNDVIFAGYYNVEWDKSANTLEFKDGAVLSFGNGNDLQITHNTSGQSRIDESKGSGLEIGSIQVTITPNGGGEKMAEFNASGSADLYYNNSKKFETTTTGATVTGTVTASGTGGGAATLGSHLDLGDSQKVRLGASDDLDMYHDGTDSYIRNNTGQLLIRGNDIKLNNYLGTKTHAEFADGGLTTGAIDLSAISASISGTAVDVFVYDTRKDSDGGAWRKRTQHTSWYNETLNTATRGSRKEFPAVAVIVTTATNVTIYDGDDPDLPMWMDFQSGSYYFIGPGNRVKNSAHMLNGILCVTKKGSISWMSYISFVDDKARQYSDDNNEKRDYVVPISHRNANNANSVVNSIQKYTIVNDATNDVAMTVLPNAPVDDSTGLPVPTIAVATDSGISVITDSGSVYDLTTGDVYDHYSKVEFGDNNRLYYTAYDTQVLYSRAIPSADQNYTAYNTQNTNRVMFPTMDHGGFTSGHPVRLLGTNGGTNPLLIVKNKASGSNETSYAPSGFGIRPGLTFIDEGETNPTSMVAYATTSYNTGYMQGDIKGAFLSDTDTTNATYTTVADDWATAGAWTKQSSISLTSTGSGTSGTVSITGNGTGSNVYFFNPITVEANTDYIVTITFGAYNANDFFINTTQYSTSNKVLDIHGQSGLARGGYFNPGSNTTLYIQGYQVSTTATTITNVVVQKVSEKDRSVNNKGFQVFGTITKTAVATGADLVSYSGYSNSNYLKQLYNSGLDFGTGDFSVTWWQYITGDITNSEYVYDRQGGNGNRHAVYYTNQNSGSLALYTNSGSSSEILATGINSYKDGWTCYSVSRSSSGLMQIYVNGELKQSTTLTVRNLSNTSAELFIGIRHSVNSGSATQAKYALMRFSKSIPSPEQIKKIYEEEKVLFQENVKCTLHGSSDAVTALGYDEDTELLHVGTSSGRSDFQGLRRINNTTTAVTTAISASDDLIAEQ